MMEYERTKKAKKMTGKFNRIEADIDVSAIRHNVMAVKEVNDKDKKTLLVIKADAYGHGAVFIAKHTLDLADYFATATIDEAVELRENGIEKPILILGYTDEEDFDKLINFNITQAVYDVEKCRLLSEKAVALGKKARVHIKADSGMSRIGFQCNEEGVALAKTLKDMPGLNIEGIFTHYAKADEYDKSAASSQYEKFTYFVNELEKAGFEFKLKHIDNSAGSMEIHSEGYNMMRLGIVIYGLYPSEEVSKDIVIKPAMTLKSHVVHVKTLEPGRGVSYGWTYKADKPVRVATVSCGYADGYPRAQSGQGRVLINGQYANILGRVCMDQMMIDVTDIPDVKVRDDVILIGTVGDKCISVEEVAAPANSFNYELVCNVARRVPRVFFIDGNEAGSVNYLTR